MNNDRQYVRISLKGGSAYIQPLNELLEAIDGELDGVEEGESITLTLTAVNMSQEEYEKLPEFSGH